MNFAKLKVWGVVDTVNKNIVFTSLTREEAREFRRNTSNKSVFKVVRFGVAEIDN